MSTRILSEKKAKKYQHLPLHGEETGFKKARPLPEGVGAGAKGARRRSGPLNTAECGHLYKGGPAHVLYKDARGVVCEQDIRPVDEKKVRLDTVKRKEQIKFRVAVLKNRSGKFYFTKMDEAVLSRIAELLIQGVEIHKICEHNPYSNKNYHNAWLTWSLNVVANHKTSKTA